MCDVAFLAQAEVRLSITIVFCHCASSAMSLFRDENGWRIYGPVETELTNPWLLPKQINTVRKKYHTTPYLEGWVGGVAPRARHNARHALAIGRGLCCPIEVYRLHTTRSVHC